MRGGKVFLIIGGRGSGKTTYLEKTLPKRKTVVLQLFFDDRYKGFPRIKYEDLKINSDIFNKKIVIEDATQLIASNATKLIKQIIVSSKQMGSDIYLIFHSFNVVPPLFWQLFDYCIVFDASKAHFTPFLLEYSEIITKIQSRKTKKYDIKGVFQHN